MKYDHFLGGLLGEKFILTLGWARRGKATLGSIWKPEHKDTFVEDGGAVATKVQQQLLTVSVIKNNISLHLIAVKKKRENTAMLLWMKALQKDHSQQKAIGEHLMDRWHQNTFLGLHK